MLKLIFASKYNNYVLVNSNNSKGVLCNNKVFSKILLTPEFTISEASLPHVIEGSVNVPSSVNIAVTDNIKVSTGVEIKENSMNNNIRKQVSNFSQQNKSGNDIFDTDIEHNRITIIKEIGFKILELKGNIKSAGITSFCLNAAMVILAVVSSFGITNFLLGFKIDNSSSVLNLTTNVGFLVCVTAIVLAICLILRQGVYSLLFLFVIYVMNLFYYKAIPGFAAASLFVSLLFVGSLAAVTVAGGWFKFQIKNYKQLLTNCEYREDFETVMKSYRGLISSYVNKLSQNKINSVKSALVNNQLKMVVEVFVGLLTSPFLAYGVSNTLASCFPEAANWVRISGLRFSPIFLTFHLSEHLL